jgi:DNA-binding transcriptional regulator YiaG
MPSKQMKAREFRSRLKQAGISQRQFALWLGFDVGTVNRWARGRRDIPQYIAVIVDILAENPNLAPQRA